MAQVEALVPHERVTRVRGLAIFAVGMIWAGTVPLHQVAAALPLGMPVPSTERRLRRLLANPAVTVETLWRPLLPHLLRCWAGHEVVLVWHLALWWLHALGAHVIKRGMRPQVDRPDRRERSLVRLGWLWLRLELDHGRCPPLLCRLTDGGWPVRATP
jgi:hypothetical protein